MGGYHYLAHGCFSIAARMMLSAFFRMLSRRPAAGAKVYAELSRYDLDGGMVLPATAMAVADPGGKYVIELWPNERGSGSSQYRITIQGAGTLVVSLTAVVPDGDGPVPLEAIINQAPYPPLDQAQAAVLQAQKWAVEASSSAGKALASQEATGTDARAAHADAEQTVLDREQTRRDAVTTGEAVTEATKQAASYQHLAAFVALLVSRDSVRGAESARFKPDLVDAAF